ncbi:MAG: phage terminase large subunit family protein [Desulfobacteraceae bacterium]|nr:phage terminase large subunit family protein [Desulfobacteraceae bacterium]
MEPLSIDWTEGERLAFKPPSKLKVSEWAERHRILQAGISRQPGPWSNDTTPYLVEVMDTYNDPDVRHIVCCFGTQLGKTEFEYNVLGYIIDQDPYSTLVVYPREDDSKNVSRARIQPMINDCPTLLAKKPARQDLFQLLEMHFPGMILYLVGANSPAALAQKPCRNILRDEIDKFPNQIGNDADPLSLSEERSKSFWDIRKILDVSSPTLEDTGIWKQLQSCDEIRERQAPCPHCRHPQTIEFKNIRWQQSAKETPWPERIQAAKSTAHYICEKCGERIENDSRAWMLQNGRWAVVKKPAFKPQKVGFRLPSWHSPWLTWGDIAEKFLKAMQAKEETGDTEPLKNFWNGWGAEPWKQIATITSESKILSARCVLPPQVVPREAVALTCGIDCQKQGFYFVVRAWAKDMTSWLVRYGFLLSWEDVQRLIFEDTYEIEGSDMRASLWRVAIDTGGGEGEGDRSMTEEAYSFIAQCGKGVFGFKGSSREMTGKMKLTVIASKPGKKNIPIPGGGLRLWVVDTDYFKDLFHNRLQIKAGDPGAIYLHRDTDQDYARQIVSEEKRRGRDGRYKWVRVRGENHYFDAEIMASCLVDPVCYGGLGVIRASAIADQALQNEKSTKPKLIKSKWMQ